MAGKMICMTGASLASLRFWLVKSLLDPGYRVRGTVCNPGGGCVVYEKGLGQGSQIWKDLFSNPFTYLKKGLVSCYLSGDFLQNTLLFLFFWGEFSQPGDQKKG